MDREKVIKELHDARRYLEDKEWADRGASPHIDAINDVLALLKEQESIIESLKLDLTETTLRMTMDLQLNAIIPAIGSAQTGRRWKRDKAKDTG